MKLGYRRYHQIVAKKRGNPRCCENCYSTEAHSYEWANINGKYDDIWDYKRLCKSCHAKFDGVVPIHNGKNKISHKRKEYLRKWRIKNIDRLRKKEREHQRKWRKNNPQKEIGRASCRERV